METAADGNVIMIGRGAFIILSKNLLDRLKLQKGDEVALIGMLNGYEIWKRETLQAEIDKQNEQDRRQYEQARTQYHQMGETSSE